MKKEKGHHSMNDNTTSQSETLRDTEQRENAPGEFSATNSNRASTIVASSFLIAYHQWKRSRYHSWARHTGGPLRAT